MWKPRYSLPSQFISVLICPDDKCSRTNDEEQAMGLDRIFHFWKKTRIKAERQCDLRRLVEVRLQNMPASRQLRRMACNRERVLVEDEKAFENLEILFVQDCAANAVVQLLIGEGSFGMKALVR